MGVISNTVAERDAQGRPDSEATENGSQHGERGDTADVPATIDPFLQQYQTERYQTNDETVEQMLTLVIAAANVFN